MPNQISISRSDKPPTELSDLPLSPSNTISLQKTAGLSTNALLAELDVTFPEESPSRAESHDDLMWRGGQRNVVNWIRERIKDD